jgi:flagellar motor switch protein FliM
MENREKDWIISFYKRLALSTSDMVSSKLKLNFDMKSLEYVEGEYSDFEKILPPFAYIAIYQYLKRGVLLSVDPRIIYILSNRMLGGKGEIEKKPKPKFTFSEDFFGKEFISWFSYYYEENELPLKYLRIENSVDHTHYFFPDDPVVLAKLNCSINKKEIGSIVFCHPKSFLDLGRTA